ncbi:DUF4282 domain-containing protein [Salmonella enterica subsp. enterica]|nr:DUF4282 domain-containing protein [Salmonella enterica subsp. enterica]
MANNEIKQFATFEKLITPQIITIIYWATTILTVIGGGAIIFKTVGDEISTFGLIITLIGIRIMFELIIVSFKNNEYLRRICEATEAKKAE